MASKIKQFLKKISIKRTTVIFLLFIVMSVTLVHRLFVLQILQGDDFASQFSNMTTRTRQINSTRGTIYDRNGNVLASDQVAYSLTLEDNGSYDTTRQRNLTLNSVAYEILRLLEENGDTPDRDFHIVLDEGDNYIFDTSNETTLARFRADIYGHALTDDLTTTEKTATPQDIMDYLSGPERFSILLEGENAYTSEELKEYGLPAKYKPQDLLDITIIRYALSNNTFQRYMSVTVASDVSNETVAAIMENQDSLQGVDILEDSVRIYEDALYFANIIGYTGRASTEELEGLQEQNPDYNSTSVVGKTGIEQYMELQLQGTDGEETVYVDSMGKVLKINEDTQLKPKSGNDVYLTIDKNLQIACYRILEQRIAGILLNNIVPGKTFDVESVTDANQVQVPIYDVYNALIGNSVININHFTEGDASETEKNLYAKFQQKQSQIFDRIKNELTTSQLTPYKELDEELQEYIDYVVNDLLTTRLGVISADAIDSTDSTYIAWNEKQSISLQEYLTYAASQNWIDLSVLSTEGEYLDSNEIYAALGDYIVEYLETDSSFSRLLYKYLLMEDTISGTELCTILYDQGVLSKDDGMYEGLVSGQISSYDFMIEKINQLEITPGQLALDPCSGSIVVTDPDNGQVLACVTYPGYDNNRLANNMDVAYYNQLLSDKSEPFYNKATQQRTAPGSTFKLVSTIAGMGENLISDGAYIECNGKFEEVGYDINCWNRQGHGALEIRGAIEQSCNAFFNTIGFWAGIDSEKNYSETRSLEVLHKYASMMDLDKKTGIEIDEAAPQVSDSMAVPSYMGQGTHLYTTTELARYASILANKGTSYQLSLLNGVSDPQGNSLQGYTAKVSNELNVTNNVWDDIHDGMRRVVETHSEFDNLGMSVAGKTGTAQESNIRPDHGLFVGFAPYDDPQISMAIRIPYGYGSGNACLVANDVLQYYFNLEEDDKILTGTASSTASRSSND